LHQNDELRLSASQLATFGKELPSDLYPEYYILKIRNFDDTTRDMLDEWIYFLKNSVIKNDFKAQGLAQARIVLARDNLSPEEQKAYDYMLTQRSKNSSAIASMRLEGEIEGRKEGRKEGIKEGRKEREKLANELEKERKEHEKERETLLAEIARLKQNNKKNNP
jgi:predicted transposase YdaD